MTEWDLGKHGDWEERLWWATVVPRFANYEVLWANHVVPLTFRVVNPKVIFLRPSVPDHLRDLANANYSVFWHLAKAHVLLETPQSFGDRSGLFYVYSHLYAVCESVSRFLRATNKILDYYDIPYIPKSERRLPRFGDESLATDFDDLHTTTKEGYRGCMTHNYGHVQIGGAVPQAHRVDDYTDLGSVARLVMHPDGQMVQEAHFVENQVQKAQHDTEELESILNRIWGVVLQELEAVAGMDDYRRDQAAITSEEEQFANEITGPAAPAEMQSWKIGDDDTSGSAVWRGTQS